MICTIVIKYWIFSRFNSGLKTTYRKKVHRSLSVWQRVGEVANFDALI